MLSLPNQPQPSATNYDLSESEACQDIEPKVNNRYKQNKTDDEFSDNSEGTSQQSADNQFTMPLQVEDQQPEDIIDSPVSQEECRPTLY
jgi:hypothetical protein